MSSNCVAPVWLMKEDNFEILKLKMFSYWTSATGKIQPHDMQTQLLFHRLTIWIVEVEAPIHINLWVRHDGGFCWFCLGLLLSVTKVDVTKLVESLCGGVAETPHKLQLGDLFFYQNFQHFANWNKCTFPLHQTKETSKWRSDRLGSASERKSVRGIYSRSWYDCLLQPIIV